MTNKWFEETFIPSLESKMNNSKYPGKIIITERQAEICEKYMKCKPEYYIQWIYDIGCDHYCMYRAGKYTFFTKNI